MAVYEGTPVFGNGPVSDRGEPGNLDGAAMADGWALATHVAVDRARQLDLILGTMTPRERAIRECAAEVTAAEVLSPEWELVRWVERSDVGPRWEHLFGGGTVTIHLPGMRGLTAPGVYRAYATYSGGKAFTASGPTAVEALRAAVGTLYSFTGAVPE